MKNKIYKNLEELLEQNRVLYNFGELCKIPHMSFKEKQMGDYLLNWAKDRGLEATQDYKWNVFIKKPATAGYELAPVVMLQAHMDMVCEKAPGVIHDFETDPIHLELNGDILSTGGQTTLGADDGIGVAYAMTILEADDIPHPPLEVLFTTAEEEDLSGAQEVDASGFKARMLINIDNAVEHELLAGSCGGMGVELTFSSDLCNAPNSFEGYRVSISGLPGGHSGEDINKGHGNANSLIGRLLYSYRRIFPFYLQELVGGSFRLALPREANAILLISPEKVQELRQITNNMEHAFKREYEMVAPEFTIKLEKVMITDRKAASPAAVKRLLAALFLSPDGISTMNNAVMGIVESSDNMGEIRMENGKFIIVYEIRASFESTREYIYQKIKTLAELLGGECHNFAEYPSWSFNPESKLRKLTSEIYHREFNDEINTMVVHCGLECGCLFPKMPGLDAISIGPDAWGLHSPQERLSISSTERIFHLLKAVLADIH
ncbi:MAG: beta-Ala-His dipeptidase [Clostridium sp.]